MGADGSREVKSGMLRTQVVLFFFFTKQNKTKQNKKSFQLDFKSVKYKKSHSVQKRIIAQAYTRFLLFWVQQSAKFLTLNFEEHRFLAVMES